MTNKNTTVLETSVSADERQPNVINTDDIISDNSTESNSYDEYIRQEMLNSINPYYLKTVPMSKLYDNVYQSKPPIIDGLLYPGIYLFVGAPKIGKSFLMAQLAYHVSTGTELWGYEVKKGAVLYLALEDDYRRLQERFYRMFGTNRTENLYLSVSANQLGSGLYEQLTGFIGEHKDTALIIIDTLQKVRECGGDKYSYAGDYEIINSLKKFTDNYGVCLLLVHHTRKQTADDKFDMISGTTGLLGAADGAFLLQKEKRTSNAATLEVSGRDQQDQKLYLKRNTETLLWELERTETELWKEPPEPLLEKISKIFSSGSTEWNGTATELCSVLQLDIQPNALTRKLNVNAGRLYNEYGICYENSRSRSERTIRLVRLP